MKAVLLPQRANPTSEKINPSNKFIVVAVPHNIISSKSDLFSTFHSFHCRWACPVQLPVSSGTQLHTPSWPSMATDSQFKQWVGCSRSICFLFRLPCKYYGGLTESEILQTWRRLEDVVQLIKPNHPEYIRLRRTGKKKKKPQRILNIILKIHDPSPKGQNHEQMFSRATESP